MLQKESWMGINTGGVVYPDPFPRGVVFDKNVPVTMRNGIRLDA
jgi:hypothetical protein